MHQAGYQNKDAVLQFVPVDENIFPVHLKDIQAKQAKDRDLRQKVKTNLSHFQKTVNLIKTSYFSPCTIVLSLPLQPSRILKQIVY